MGGEIAPGVVVERRSVLWVSAVAAAGWLLGGRTRASSQDPGGEMAPEEPGPSGDLDWEAFLERCVPAAARLRADASRSGQDAYLYRIASMAVRLGEVPDTPLRAFGRLDPPVSFGISHRAFPFFVVQWRMAPGAVLPAHCHPGGAVCTVGVEGEALLRHYEVEGGAPAYDSGSRETFRMRETRSQVVGPRQVSTLSTTRDNVHWFKAGPAGARGIDITTNYDGDGTFSFIEFDPEKPVDPKRRLFESVWIGSKL